MSSIRPFVTAAALIAAIAIAPQASAVESATDGVSLSEVTLGIGYTGHLNVDMTKHNELRKAGELGIQVRVVEQTITGFAGCNTFSGKIVREGAKSHLANIGTTRKMCDAPRMKAERALLDLLATPSTWVDNNAGRLTVAASSNRETVFTVGQPAVKLTKPESGKYFALVSHPDINDGQWGVIVRFNFDTNAGTFDFDAGCNQVWGKAAFNDRTGMVTFSSVNSTFKHCEGAVGDVEQTVVKALSGSASYTMDGEHFVLRKGTPAELRIERDIVMGPVTTNK